MSSSSKINSRHLQLSDCKRRIRALIAFLRPLSACALWCRETRQLICFCRRLLDLLLDLNASLHVPKDRRFNLGSPTSATPTHFLSPSLLATLTGEDGEALAAPGTDIDVDPMQLEPTPVNGSNANAGAEEQDDSTDEDDEDDDVTPNQDYRLKHGGSEDEGMDDEDREAYLEEIRESNYKRGIPGTPPKCIRDELRANAARERKNAKEQAKKAAAEVAAANGFNGSAPLVLKQEPTDENSEIGIQEPAPPHTPMNRKPLVLESTYRPGKTPPYLRRTSPFLMSLEEEEAFYYNVDENLNGEIPVHPEDLHASPNADKGGGGDPRNPMSVYCWLRKYQPQVFLQETEGDKKFTRGRGAGRRKTGDSGDEMPPIARAAGNKRRRTTGGDEAEEQTPQRAPRGRGGRGSRKKPTEGGEPPAKRQRRLVARNS